MKSFVIKCLKHDVDIFDFEIDNEGFHYKIKNNNDLGVREIIIISPQIISGLIVANFNKYYKKILEYYLGVLDSDDDTEGMLVVALNEITRLKNIILKKYHRFLRKKEEDKMLKKLRIMEEEIKLKIVDLKLIKEAEVVQTNVEEKSKSR